MGKMSEIKRSIETTHFVRARCQTCRWFDEAETDMLNVGSPEAAEWTAHYVHEAKKHASRRDHFVVIATGTEFDYIGSRWGSSK